MQILFRCRHCFAECRARPSRDKGLVQCPSCRRQLVLRYSDACEHRNLVDICPVCQNRDFYLRDEARKAWGLVYLVAGIAFAYWSYGATLIFGVYGFYRHFVRYPKVTVCYHCYSKYRNCRVNPEHREYDLERMADLERSIRNDRTFRDFK